jgi:hypothetical protein
MTTIGDWLAPIDAFPLECDGLTRIVSTLLARDDVEHRVCVGSLDIQGVGLIPLHWWVELGDGRVIDYRARMWLGDGPQTPHGVFLPSAPQQYVSDSDTKPRGTIAEVSATVFHILAGVPLSTFPRLPRLKT